MRDSAVYSWPYETYEIGANDIERQSVIIEGSSVSKSERKLVTEQCVCGDDDDARAVRGCELNGTPLTLSSSA